jgi:hypothetical protein
MLDLAKFSKKLSTGSTSVFALEFSRPDKSNVTTLWTIRGERDLKLSFSGGGEVTTTVAMGNQKKHQSVGREVNVTINSPPLYVTGAEISGIKCGEARYRAGVAPNAQVVSPMNTLDSWQVVPHRDQVLERHIVGVWQFELGAVTFEVVDAEGESWSNMGAAAEDGLEHERHGEHNVREFRWLASTLGSAAGSLPVRQLQLAAKLQLASSRRQRFGRLPVAINRAGGRAARKACVH